MTNNLQDRFREKFVHDCENPDIKCVGGDSSCIFRETEKDFLDFTLSEVEQAKKDLINQILTEAPEEIVMMCFCGELKDKYNCDGYCNCGAFIKNRRGYSGEEQGKMDGFNEANKQWKDNLTKLINSN